MCFGAASPAAAQDTGAYLKLHPGVDAGHADVGHSTVLDYQPKSLAVVPARETRELASDSSETAEIFSQGGFTGGFGYKWNRLYGALEADVSRYEERPEGALIAPSLDNAVGGRISRSYGLSGVLGMEITEGALVYGRMGYLRGNVDPATQEGVLGGAPSDVRGLSLGAGVAMEATDRLSVFGEFLHFDFESLRDADRPGLGASDTSVFRAGVRYRF